MNQRRSGLVTFFTLVVVGAAITAGCGGSGGGDDTTGATGDDGGGGGGGGGGGKDSGGGADATITTTNDGSTGGGTTPDAAIEAGPACTQNTDCASKVCLPTGVCAAPSCMDGAQNGTETDTDCGGSCSPCDSLKRCALAADCISGVCNGTGTDAGLLCQAPTNTDGVKNGNETGIDCGGTGNKACPDGQGCAAASDCTSDVCTADVCAASVCNDGIKNGTETDVDCGGGNGCGRCVDGDTCLVGTDCLSSVCKSTKTGDPLTCQTATYTDGVQNGPETDVDCGGDLAHPCPVNDMCLIATDCQSAACAYNHICAIGKSCTGNSSGGRYGADTCGRGGAGGVGDEAWESCCATVDISVKEGTMTAAQVMHIDKYKTTAGRMRAFLESVNYDVKDFVQSARKAGKIPVVPVQNGNPAGLTVLDPAWDQYLSTSYDGDSTEAADCDQSGWNESTETCTNKAPNTPYSPIYTAGKNHVGPTVWKANSQTEQGCEYGLPGTHTYYEGSPDYEGATPEHQNQSDYDVKPLQCVDYLTAQAFCIWDGGRLETYEEWLAAWGSGAMPWSADTTDKTSTGVAYSTVTPHSDYVANYTNTQTCTTNMNDATFYGYVCNGGTTYTTNGTPVYHSNTCNSSGLCTPAPTYTACRFPQANDTTILNPALGCLPYTNPPKGQTIELADWESSYEYPQLGSTDFMVFMSAPGRMPGRGPKDVTTGNEGVADIIGDTFELTSDVSNVSKGINPFPTAAAPANIPGVRWSGNGSWEVHGYTKGGYGPYRLMDKYGKLGLRCIHPT